MNGVLSAWGRTTAVIAPARRFGANHRLCETFRDFFDVAADEFQDAVEPAPREGSPRFRPRVDEDDAPAGAFYGERGPQHQRNGRRGDGFDFAHLDHRAHPRLPDQRIESRPELRKIRTNQTSLNVQDDNPTDLLFEKIRHSSTDLPAVERTQFDRSVTSMQKL